MTDNKIDPVWFTISGSCFPAGDGTWRISVKTSDPVTFYQAITWAEVEAHVRRILDEHGIPADPTTRIEAWQLEQTQGNEP